METSRVPLRTLILGLHLCVAALSVAHNCDAKRSSSSSSMHPFRGPRHRRGPIITKQAATKRLQVSKHLIGLLAQLDASNAAPYGVSSPFSLTPYDSLPPVPLPDINAPPFCLYPPFTPQPPSSTIPFSPPELPPPGTGTGGGGGGGFPIPPSLSPPGPPSTGVGGGFPPLLPPPSFSTPPFLSTPPSPSESGSVPTSPPQSIPSPILLPSPPESVGPSPPAPVMMSPPNYYEPSPPYSYEPSPPGNVVPSPLPPPPPFSTGVPPSPSIFVPSPPVFQPPVVYPPPTVPPSPKRTPSVALWCVAKPTVPDPIIQEAMNYACGSGADCDSLQPSGSCFQPNTLFAHASYAFNSYWQRTKVAGGTCEFGGTAILVTVDPSYDGCHFVYY